jgi:hypothetical protein
MGQQGQQLLTRDVCTAVRVAQRVCVYGWTIIYISGIVIANIYYYFDRSVFLVSHSDTDDVITRNFSV